MKEDRLNSILYKIIKGRLRITYNGLSLYIYEPNSDVIARSYEIYDEEFQNSYIKGVYIDEEAEELLVENGIWNPLMERDCDTLRTQIEDIKVECYDKFYDKKLVRSLKGKIGTLERSLSRLLNDKHSMDHLTCSGAAENARSLWLISQTTYNEDGSPFNWSSNKADIVDIINIYRQSMIKNEDIRYIARNDPWRSMWSISKKNGSLFDRLVIDYTRDQLSLCSYSIMYDNIYDHPESPSEDIINDDICLDGWMIKQKRKQSAEKKKKSTEDILTNEKIRNSKEVFIVADNPEAVRNIMDMNDAYTKSIIKQREAVIKSKDKVKDTDFVDVQTELQSQKNKMFVDKFKGRK